MSDVATFIAQEEQNKSGKKKVASVGLAALLSMGCLGAGLAYLTDTDTTDHNISLAGFDRVDEDTVPDDIFEIHYTNGLDDIVNAMPGQKFEDVALSVTNNNISVDSSYMQVEFEVPYYKDAAKDLAFFPLAYNWNTTDWDIQGLEAADEVTSDGITMIPVTAQFKTAVAAGDATENLFTGMTVDKDITREILIDLARALGADSTNFGLTFDALGIQTTGFADYNEAFSA